MVDQDQLLVEISEVLSQVRFHVVSDVAKSSDIEMMRRKKRSKSILDARASLKRADRRSSDQTIPGTSTVTFRAAKALEEPGKVELVFISDREGEFPITFSINILYRATGSNELTDEQALAEGLWLWLEELMGPLSVSDMRNRDLWDLSEQRRSRS